MNKKPFVAGLLALGLLASCDNGIISGPTYADIDARVTPFRGVFDSVGIDVRVGSFRGPLRDAYINSPKHSGYDPDQIQIRIPDLPVGNWTIVAVYYKTYWTKTSPTDSVVKSTGHRAAVAQGSVSVNYDSECQCNVVEGDNVDLRLKD